MIDSYPARLATLLMQAGQICGSDHVIAADGVVARYGSATTGAPLRAGGAVVPGSVEEVRELLLAATKQRIPLYPVSTGNNWGYGAALPPDPAAVIVDLHRLNQIDDSQLDLGVVTLEPGVTQQQLADFLDTRGYDFMVPVHGGGPKCSIVGNLLERGYGITPHTDHFAAVTAIEALLPNGEIFRSAVHASGGAGVDALFKWGAGPYLDGLFTQGAFGIVTRASVVLAPRPERVESFVFRIADNARLGEAVVAVREIIRSLPGTAAAINLMNARRVLSMMIPFPADELDRDGVVRSERIAQLAKEYRVAAWTGFGALYGTPGAVRAARTLIRRRLRGISSRPIFIRPGLARSAASWLDRLPAGWAAQLRAYLATLNKSLVVVEGRPAEIALPLVYWRQGGAEGRTGLDPARDQRGLIWYAPLVPARPAAVETYVALADRVCREHAIEPLITLTTLSDRCFDSTVPILFDASDEEEVARGQRCYRALVAAGKEHGFVPYRYPAHEMQHLIDADATCWRWLAELKRATDPANILSPGRYAPLPRSD